MEDIISIFYFKTDYYLITAILLRKVSSTLLWGNFPPTFLHLYVFFCFASVPETPSTSHPIAILRGAFTSFVALNIYI